MTKQFITMPFVLPAILLSIIFVAGCKKNLGDMPLEGIVTFEGKPVPGGIIQFMPDNDKGNSGTGASATIENGKYVTNKKRGVFGGAYVVTVYGTDGTTPEDINADISIFDPYVLHVELPKGGNFDIAIPDERGKFVKFKSTSF